MGIFGMFNSFNKVGPGIYKDEPQKKRFFVFWDIFIRKFWKLIQVNLVYILFCIPIVTIGPATAGLTYVVRNYSREEHSFIFSDFFEAFKKNFLQSFIYSVFSLLAGGVIAFAVYFYFINLNAGTYMYALLTLSIAIAVVFITMNFYVYLMIVTLNLKLKAIIKNAFIFTIVGMKTNILTFIFTVPIHVLMILYFPITLIPIVVIVFSFTQLITCFNSYQYLQKHIIDPYYEQNAEEKEIPKEIESIFDDKIKLKDID